LSIKTGKVYEWRLISLLLSLGIFAVGLQPNVSPDIIVPKARVGIEVKSTSRLILYQSQNPEQSEYLKERFSIDWPGWRAFYGVYFTKKHEWKFFLPGTKLMQAGDGWSFDEFIAGLRRLENEQIAPKA